MATCSKQIEENAGFAGFAGSIHYTPTQTVECKFNDGTTQSLYLHFNTLVGPLSLHVDGILLANTIT